MSVINTRKVLAFAAAVEVATGLALMIAPALVVVLLLGAEVSDVGMVVSRFFGIALLALGIACWPDWRSTGTNLPAVLAMFIYNALVALYLAELSTVERLQGLLLWPVAILHAILAILLAWTSHGSWRGSAPEAKAK